MKKMTTWNVTDGNVDIPIEAISPASAALIFAGEWDSDCTANPTIVSVGVTDIAGATISFRVELTPAGKRILG